MKTPHGSHPCSPPRNLRVPVCSNSSHWRTRRPRQPRPGTDRQPHRRYRRLPVPAVLTRRFETRTLTPCTIIFRWSPAWSASPGSPSPG